MEFQLPARIKLPELQNTYGLSVHNNTSTKGQPWTDEEHLRFLQGLNTYGKGKWRQIARSSLHGTKTPTQVASHAQKYFSRQSGKTKRASRFTSIELNVQRNEAARATNASSAQAATSGSAFSETSCCSDGGSQEYGVTTTRPCRPTACKPSQPGQVDQAKSMLEAVLRLSQRAQLGPSAPSIRLPSPHSAFSAATGNAVMV